MKSATKKQGTLFLIVGPSQVGKDSIIRALLKRRSLQLRKVVTMTTRQKRPKEIDNVSYFFVSDDEFDREIQRGNLMEWVHIQSHRSGSPKHPTIDLLKRGQNLILHIDVYGADMLMKRKDLRTFSIFIAPGSLDDIKRRLMKKHFSEHERKVRWQTTVKEMKRIADYDVRVINVQGKLNQTIHEVEEIIRAVR